MHKQRLPFNGGPGGFGASAFNFNAPQFGDGGGFGHGPVPEGLNGMPFLGKSSTKPLMRSISRQRLMVEGVGLDSLPPPLPAMAQRILSGGVGPGQRMGLPHIPNYYGSYEGDHSASSMSVLEDTTPPDFMKQTPRRGDGPSRSGGHSAFSDTDSESDLRSQQKGTGLTESRWNRAFGCLMDALPEQKRKRVRETLQRCGQTAIAKHLQVLLQLLALVMAVSFCQIQRAVKFCGGVHFRVGRAKFQLRSSLRKMLWRLANAKANDTLLFLIVVLVTPWLFLFSLVGFALSFMFSIRTGLTEGMRQMRRRVF
ncbi:uncharacterized protein LOC108113831 [Drosophila eugracilis]|uniref:uncharacterized protein LOC108113831 n=1 Tax=Drosophila eugracilis TaxID=29029 RepID=UPI0007E72B41|nr:uncharacterized protein LOC108113831 [Drosophila eugracilis]